MKKRLFLFLAAAAVVTGCSKESVVDTDINKEGNKIGFATYSNVVKGNPIDNNTEFMTEGNAFGVTAFISTDDTNPYMGKNDEGVKIEVTKVTDGQGTKLIWDYADKTNPSFWPKEALDFFAYYPYTDNQRARTSFSKDSYLTFDYTVDTDVSKQVDLMVAAATDVTKPMDKNTVKLTFQHALTQVLFQIGTKYANLTVELDVNGITLYDIKNKATFNLNGLAWSSHEGEKQYSIASNKISAGHIGVNGNGYTKVEKDGNSVLMLLPQTLKDVSLVVSCKIYQTNNSTKFYLIGSENDFGSIDVVIPNGEWKRAQRVTYKLLFGDSLDKIEFETEVEDWTNADDENLNVGDNR